jgi:transcriptional regulator with XRE-family HTH domain
MTLDQEILRIAQAARESMLERQHELERARADLSHEIRRLHAAGGSMREISEELGVSHQRVHQIVTDGTPVSDSLLRRLGERLQRGLGGGFVRFGEEARAVVERGHEEAIELGAPRVEPEHLLLALTAPQAGSSARALTEAGVTHAGMRAAVEGAHHTPRRGDRRSRRTPFADASKKALELSLREALRRGDDHIGSEHLLLGLLRGGDDRIRALLSRLGVEPDAIRQAVESL